ncbi:hypothetical protein SNE40_005417 [Patella caerulea]|uniref:G-protein coupled receptors family 2 profile 2 domain-containing protein n=1 Tax=Patella caerulea TaxID=87958 RepID=A0AAN8KA27_PATCE
MQANGKRGNTTKVQMEKQTYLFIYCCLVLRGFERTLADYNGTEVFIGLTADDTDLLSCRRCNHRPTDGLLTQPSCVECMCDLDCIKYGDCCIDVMVNLGLHTQPPPSEFTCVSPELETSIFSLGNMANIMGGYYMKTQFIDANDRHQRCNNSPVLPVTCQSTGITYINMECAFLNLENRCKHWSLHSECDAIGTDQNNVCKTYLIPPFFTELRYCDARRSQPVISQCLPESTDKEKCNKYFYLVYGDDGRIYKNIFCYLCNNNSLGDIIGETTNPVEFITSFTDLFEKAVNREPCDGSKAWMDFHVNKCRPIRCDSNKVLRGGYCEHDNRTAVGNSYHLLQQLSIKPTDRIHILKQAVHNVVTGLSYEINSTDYHISVTNQVPVSGESVVYVDIWFTITSNVSLNDFEINILQLGKQVFHRFSAVQVFNSVNYTRLGHHQSLFGNYSSDLEANLCCALDQKMMLDTNKYEPITHQLTCSYIEFNSDEFSLKYMVARIDHLNITLCDDQFSLYKNQLRVCFELFLNKTGLTYNNETVFYNIEGESSDDRNTGLIKFYLSIILMGLSMLGLLLTFITYLRFREMRTQPGTNNMCLVISLFVANVMVLVGVEKVDNIIACQILGVAIHYLWLSMLLWMNVCSYHMFKVFVLGAFTVIGSSNSVKQTLAYCLYANGTPIVIVTTNIISNYILSDGTDIGYGDKVCYLSTPQLVIYCFIVPLCFVILTNIIFFLSTIISIHRVKQTGKQTAERHNIYIYMKLSVLTGCFWIFAIIANTVRSPIVEYMSVILNSSQGIFLFWSLVLNKTVLSKYRRPAADVSESSSNRRIRWTGTDKPSSMSDRNG